MLAVIIESVGNRRIYYGHHEDLIRKQELHRNKQFKEMRSEVNHQKTHDSRESFTGFFHRIMSQKSDMPKGGGVEMDVKVKISISFIMVNNFHCIHIEIPVII